MILSKQFRRNICMYMGSKHSNKNNDNKTISGGKTSNFAKETKSCKTKHHSYKVKGNVIDDYPDKLNPFADDDDSPHELNPFADDDYPQKHNPFGVDEYKQEYNPLALNESFKKRKFQ